MKTVYVFWLTMYIASRRGLEEQIEKLKAEKKTINAELLLLEERHGSLQDELEHMKHEIKTLTEVKVNMEVHAIMLFGRGTPYTNSKSRGSHKVRERQLLY